jgi:uncharacterized membrane protein YfcA
MGLSGLFGAILGGTIASHAPADLLKTIFGLVVLAGALRMLLAGKIKPPSEPRSGLLQYIIWGFGVGIISGLSGIGGGVILVPVMIMIMGFGILQAVGTIVAIAQLRGGIISYAVNGWGVPGRPPYSIGYINLLQFGLLAGASVLTAQLGVRYAHRIPGELLRRIFIILMIIVGLDMLGIFSRIGLPK